MAAPLPREVPATAMDLGHRIRYPLHIEQDHGAVEWRAACACHWWWLLDTGEAKEAMK